LNEDVLLQRNSQSRGAGEEQSSLLPDPIEETWELYVKLLDKPKAVLTPQRRKWISVAHKEAGVEQTQEAIRGLAASDYHRENQYTGIEYAIVAKRGQTVESRVAFMAAKAPSASKPQGGGIKDLVARINEDYGVGYEKPTEGQ
jgi:hypothetical protein